MKNKNQPIHEDDDQEFTVKDEWILAISLAVIVIGALLLWYYTSH